MLAALVNITDTSPYVLLTFSLVARQKEILLAVYSGIAFEL